MNSQATPATFSNAVSETETLSTTRAVEKLVQQIGSGSPDAEAQLCADYLEPLTRYATALTRNRTVADDLTQDALRISLERLRRSELRDAAKLWSFLKSTARNLFLYDIRKAKRRNTWSMPELPDVADDSSLPLAGLLSQEAAKRIRSLIAQLTTERDRDLIERIYLRQESTETVCRALGLGSDHLHRVLFRARKRLKKLATANPETLELVGLAA